MLRKLASMLIAVAAIALLALPAVASTPRARVHHSKAKIVETYVQQGPVAGARFYVPANRGVAAVNAFQHYDDIFVLDP
jgi:hypothetical protein